MRALAAEQKNRVSDPIAFARGDIAFQRAIVRATGNVGLELVLNSFARLPEEFPDLTASLYDRREESLAFYEGCIELVRAGDEETARITVRRMLEVIDEDWRCRNAPPEVDARANGASKERAPTKAKKGKKT